MKESLAKQNVRRPPDQTFPNSLATKINLLTSCSRWLRSLASAGLDIPRARRTTIGDRAYSVSLVLTVRTFVPVLRRLLKCELFRRCYDLC